LCGYLAAKSSWIDGVDEGPLAVDLHHREPFPVAGLEAGIAVDLDLLEVEPNLLPNLGNGPPRALAEVAALCVVEDDFRFAARVLRDRCRG
jgi:hypothetical protein